SYFTFSQALRFVVNDVAMALFFGLLTQEIFEEVMPGGALHTWRRWATPIVAAVGGPSGAAAASLGSVGLEHVPVPARPRPVAGARAAPPGGLPRQGGR